MKAAIWSAASGELRAIVPSCVRSAPTLKYLGYSDASTTTRTSGSLPSSVNAAPSSSIRSAAMALRPLRCMTTVAIPPSRLTSTHSPIRFASGCEQRNAARHLDHRAGDIARLVRAEERDRVRDVLGLPEPLEHRAGPEALVQRVGLGSRLARFGFNDPRRDRVGGDVVPSALERGCLRQPDEGRLGR